MTDPDREKLKSLAELLSFISGKSRIYVFYTLYDTETGISFAASGAGTENSYTSRILREIYEAGYASRRREDHFLFYSLSDEKIRAVLRLGVETVLGRRHSIVTAPDRFGGEKTGEALGSVSQDGLRNGHRAAIRREEAELIGAFFRVAATERRLITLYTLCHEESVEASSLAAACGVTTDVFGSQLAHLKRTGTVTAVRRSYNSYYSLKDDRWRPFLESALQIIGGTPAAPSEMAEASVPHPDVHELFSEDALDHAHQIPSEPSGNSSGLSVGTSADASAPTRFFIGISGTACDTVSSFLRTLSGESAFAVVSFLYDNGTHKNMISLSEASGLSYMKVNLSIRNLREWPVIDRTNGIRLSRVMTDYLGFLFSIEDGEEVRSFLRTISTPHAVRTILYLKTHRFAKRKDLIRDLGFSEDIAKNTIENLRAIRVLSRSRKGTIQPFRLISPETLTLIERTLSLTSSGYEAYQT